MDPLTGLTDQLASGADAEEKTSPTDEDCYSARSRETDLGLIEPELHRVRLIQVRVRLPRLVVSNIIMARHSRHTASQQCIAAATIS